MAGPAMPNQHMSLEEYLEFERNSPVEHEYVGGHVYAMAGVTRRHSRIALNIARTPADVAGGGPCRVHQSDMQAPTPDGPWYCPGPEPDDPCIEDAPCLLVEVVSPTTGSTDRREKPIASSGIPSLRACLLVDQDAQHVERRFRDADGVWQRADHISGGSMPLPCPETRLALDDVYQGL